MTTRDEIAAVLDALEMTEEGGGSPVGEPFRDNLCRVWPETRAVIEAAAVGLGTEFEYSEDRVLHAALATWLAKAKTLTP